MPALIHPDKRVEHVSPQSGDSFRLDELYKHLQCSTVEVLRLTPRTILIIDEEGKLADKPVNPVATLLAKEVLAKGDHIVGDAIVCASTHLK